MASCKSSSSRSHAGPLGFAGLRGVYHYKAVYPTSHSAMHLNMHRKAPRAAFSKSAPNTEKGLVGGMKLLGQQRMQTKRFVGIKDLSGQEIYNLSDRLARYDPIRMPAEGKGLLPPLETLDLCQRGKRVYSPEEVKRIVCKIAEQHEISDEEARAMVEKISEVSLSDHEKKVYSKLSQAEIKKIVDRLAAYDPITCPAMSRGIPSKEQDPGFSRARAVSEEELNTIVDRLAKFDPEKWPPGSPHKKFRNDPPSSASVFGKRFNAQQVDSLVERLASFDKKKWPPESVGAKGQLYSGKPLKFNNY